MTSRVKSRADKSRDKDKGGATTNKDSLSALNATNEIVAGKFSESEWHQLILDEEHQSFCSSIMEELMQKTMEECYQKYIERQLLPFTVQIAKEALTEIVELRFLSRDEGESENDFESCWIEDEEPEMVLLDSWAAGAVPYTVFTGEDTESIARTERSLKEMNGAEESAVQLESTAHAEDDEENNDVAQQEDEVSDEKCESRSPEVPPQPEPPMKPKRKYKPYRGPIGSAGVSRMSETMFETEMRLRELDQNFETERTTSHEMPARMQHALKAQAGRPPGVEDAPLSDVNVVIIDSRTMAQDIIASTQVKTNFSIVDPEVEAAQQRLIAMRTGRFNPGSLPSPSGVAAKKKGTQNGGKDGSTKKAQEFRNEQQLSYERAASNGVAPVPPPLIESMDVAPGVTVREGGRVKQGPKRLQKQSTTNKHFTETLLLPVNRPKPKQKLSVDEIINSIQTKTVKPLPPIA